MAEKTIDNTQDKENTIAKCEVTREPETYITPVTDIYEEDKGLYMMVDLPGVDQEGLKLSVEEGVLTIEGHVKQPENKEYLVREFEPVNFYRQFELSETVDQEGINAELKNGVLNIFLPRAKAVQPRTIEVKFS